MNLTEQIKALVAALATERDARKRREITQVIDNLRLQQQLMKGY